MGASTSRVVLVIGGGIAAYKSLDLIRRLRERGYDVTVVMTEAATRFVTPVAASALAGSPAHHDLWDIDREMDIGHIRMSRNADAIVVAPATADLMARLAHGIADDLATAMLLAAGDRPRLLAPAMNPRMWDNPATVRNVSTLVADGYALIGPGDGEMAESGEAGTGRMSEPTEIADAVDALIAGRSDRPLSGRRALVTSGPTREPIDPVRYISNHSSGKQGHAIARALADAGADVTLVSGPVEIDDPPGVTVVAVESAADMLGASMASLPVDIAVMAAAVADWRVAETSSGKIKKNAGDEPPSLTLTENPDILRTVAADSRRPTIVVGFAAETDDVVANATAKLARKGADLIVANDVSQRHGGVFGRDRNLVHLISAEGVESWPELDKDAVAQRLVAQIIDMITGS